MELFPLTENQTAEELLTAFLQGGQFPAALLLWGPAGTGKRTLARWLAQALVCTEPGVLPCGICAACRKAASGAHQDITFLDNHGETIKIKSVREQVLDQICIKPGEAECRVVCIMDVQNMRAEGQNALLKTLEEPPAHVHIILTATSLSAVLPTVVSRCVTVPVRTVSEDAVLEHLRRIAPDAGEDRLNLAAVCCAGSIGKGAAMLEDSGFSAVCRMAVAAAQALNDRDGGALLLALAKGDKNRPLLAGFSEFFTALLLREMGGNRRFFPSLSAEQLARMTLVMRDFDGLLPANVNTSTLLTDLHFNLMSAAGM